MPNLRINDDEMEALVEVPAQAFRLYALLKCVRFKTCSHNLAIRIFPDGEQTRFSRPPQRHQMQMMFWRLWRADLIDLGALPGGDIVATFPLDDAANPVIVSGLTNKWVARGKENPPSRPPVPKKLREQVFARDGGKCRHCGADTDLTADHIHPFALGGETTLENLQTLCRRCNSKKGKKVRHG